MADGFFQAIRNGFNLRRLNLAVVTGNIYDPQYCYAAEGYRTVEQTIYQELKGNLMIVRFDIAAGLSFFDEKDEKTLTEIWAAYNRTSGRSDDLTLQEAFAPDLGKGVQMIRRLTLAVAAAQKAAKESGKKPLPLCIIVQHAASLFPAAAWGHLGELDRQRLVAFLDLIDSPEFINSPNLMVLMAGTKIELNDRIFGSPNLNHVEVPLPSTAERTRFLDSAGKSSPLKLGNGLTVERFVRSTSGLRLLELDGLLRESNASGVPIEQAAILTQSREALKRSIGDIATAPALEHGVDDVIGYSVGKRLVNGLFAQCETPATAVSAALIAGATGVGKTHLVKGFARDCGWAALEFTGLRSSDFGGTEKRWERWRLQAESAERLVILVDEADTKFASVYQRDVHEVERRLTGLLYEMIGDKRYRSRILWIFMTARPDLMDPDLLRRCTVQLPLFDLEGEERQNFVVQMLKRAKIECNHERDLAQVMEATKDYSASNYADLVTVSLARKISPVEAAKVYKASGAVIRKRRLQSLVATQYCTYPEILPSSLATMTADAIDAEIAKLRMEVRLAT